MEANSQDQIITSECPNCMKARELRVTEFSKGKFDLLGKQDLVENAEIWTAFTRDFKKFGVNTVFSELDPNRSWLGVFCLECLTCKATVIEERMYFFVEDRGSLKDLFLEAPEDMADLSEKELEKLSEKEFEELTNRVLDEIMEKEHCEVMHKRIVISPATIRKSFKTVQSHIGGSLDAYLSPQVASTLDEDTKAYLFEFLYRFHRLLKETKNSFYAESYILSTAGIRILAELLCQLVGDDTVKGTTDKDFDRFSGIEKLGVCSRRQIDMLRSIYSAGNRAVHDGSRISSKELENSIKVIENVGELIWDEVANESSVSRLAIDIPKRMNWNKIDLVNKSDLIKEKSARLKRDNIVRPNFNEKTGNTRDE